MHIAASARICLQGLLLAASAMAVYLPGIDGPFIFDDEHTVVENTHARRLWPLSHAMGSADDRPLSGRPLVALTIAANYAVDRLEPRGYHMVNLGLHITVACVLLMLLRAVLRETAVREWAETVAFVTAVIWTVHPLGTEAVQYVTQRTELMVALFYLATLYLAWRGMHSARPRAWFVAAVAACAMGMMSKELMVSAPLVVLLMDRQFVGRTFGLALRSRWGLYAGLAATWVVLWAVAGSRQRSVGFGHGVGAWGYLMTQSEVILYYLRLCVWPWPLTVRYEWPIAESLRHTWPAMLTVGSLVLVTAWGVWRRHALSLAGVVFFFIIAQTSSVLPIVTEVVAERRMYVPLAVVILVGVLAAGHLLRLVFRERVRVVGTTLGLATAVLLGAVSAHRIGDYQSVGAAWRSVIRVYPESFWAWNNLGAMHRKRGDADLAMYCFYRTLAIRATHTEARSNIAMEYLRRGELDAAERHIAILLEDAPERVNGYLTRGLLEVARGRYHEAVEAFETAVAREPGNVDIYNNLAMAYRRIGDEQAALDTLLAAAQIDPDHAKVQENLGRVLAQRDPARAETHFRRALALEPDAASAHDQFGALLVRQGRLEEARLHFARAVALAPGDQRVRKRLAVTLARLGETELAAQQFDTLLEQSPGDDDARNRYARLLETMGQTDRARAVLDGGGAAGGTPASGP